MFSLFGAVEPPLQKRKATKHSNQRLTKHGSFVRGIRFNGEVVDVVVANSHEH